MRFSSFLTVSLFMSFFFFPPKKKIKIWMMGDSTMSIKDVKAFPENGWGMPFVYFWDSTVQVENHAQNGRSTKSFIEEKRWEKIDRAMQEGDYLLIQFGHNDEVPTKKTYATEEQYTTNLKLFVDEARAKKVTPVLITPVARRRFDSTGKVQDTHAVYAELVRKVAKEKQVPLIDLSAKSMALLQEMGVEHSKVLFNHLKPGEHPNYPDGKVDDTHFSEYGARIMAQLVLASIKDLKLELTDHIIVRKK